jgi:peptide/nickel transport system substrate-binding protein
MDVSSSKPAWRIADQGRRRRVDRTARMAAVLVATASLAVGCGGSPTSSGDRSSVLTIGIVAGNVPASLNPAQTASVASQDIFELAYSPILRIENDGSYGPGLATSWGYVGTGHEEFRFTLRDSAKFSDGTPVDAAAVVKWLSYFVKAGGTFATQMGAVASITADGRYTVDIKLKTPDTAIEWQLAQTNGLGYVASSSAVANPQKFTQNTTFGAGPYVLDASQTVPNSSYTYLPNKYYYDQSGIHFSKVILKVIPNQATMLEALESGQIDVATGSYTTASSAESAGFNVVSGRTSWDGFAYLTLGAPGNPLNNVEVRQAIDYAINREQITAGLLGKYGEPTSEWVTTDGFDPQYRNHYAYDPAKAKALLASAGYRNGVTVSVLDFPGTLQDGTPSEQMVQVVAQQLAAVGIKLDITTLPPSQLGTALVSGRYQMIAYYFGINPTQVYWNFFLSPTAPLNLKHWTGDAEATTDFTQAEQAEDASPDLMAVSQRLTNIAYPLPIYTPLSLVFAKKNIGGVAFPVLPNGIANGTFPDPTQFYVK